MGFCRVGIPGDFSLNFMLILAIAECEAFDPATHEWTFVSPMHQARAQAACCVFEGEMWVAGGFDVGHNMTSSVESYNPVTDTWTR